MTPRRVSGPGTSVALLGYSLWLLSWAGHRGGRPCTAALGRAGSGSCLGRPPSSVAWGSPSSSGSTLPLFPPPRPGSVLHPPPPRCPLLHPPGLPPTSATSPSIMIVNPDDTDDPESAPSPDRRLQLGARRSRTRRPAGHLRGDQSPREPPSGLPGRPGSAGRLRFPACSDSAPSHLAPFPKHTQSLVLRWPRPGPPPSCPLTQFPVPRPEDTAETESGDAAPLRASHGSHRPQETA